jgi:tetratricopeptide (TPR) repeat protein
VRYLHSDILKVLIYSRYNHILFIDGSTAATIRGDLESAIRSLDGHQKDTYEAALSFMSNASSHIEWLYIIDNADDPDLDLTPYLPNCSHGTIIITSRNRKTRHLASTYHLELGPMLSKEAIETLCRAARKATPLKGEELGQASALVEELGCLPLAVVQAGIYISEMSSGLNENGFAFGQYLSLFKRHREQLLRQRGQVALDKYPNGVYAALDLSYGRLSEPCRQFLHLCSFFRYSNIPVPVFSSAAEANFEDEFLLSTRDAGYKEVQNQLRQLFCQDDQWDELGFNDILQSLSSLSLVSISSTHELLLLRFHPLVHSYAGDRLGTEERAMYKQMAVACISTSYPSLSDFAERYALPHCMLCNEPNGKESLHPNDLVQFGRMMYSQGSYHAAEQVLRKALDDIGSIWVYSHHDSPSIFEYLADTIWHQGRWNDAEALGKEAVSICQENLGPENPCTIRAVINLAWMYSERGKWTEAEALQKQVLTMFETTLEPDHPDKIKNSADLSFTLYKQCKFDEAEALGREVLAMRQKLYGPDHRDTLEDTASLASILRDQGKLQEAEVMDRQVLASRSRILGPDHPETINASSGLAKTLSAQGKHKESEDLKRETLALHEKILGKEHPWTILNIHNLAHSIYCQGRVEEALPLSLQATQLAEKIIGLHHPYILDYLWLLSQCHQSLGNHIEAASVNAKMNRIKEQIQSHHGE